MIPGDSDKTFEQDSNRHLMFFQSKYLQCFNRKTMQVLCSKHERMRKLEVIRAQKQEHNILGNMKNKETRV